LPGNPLQVCPGRFNADYLHLSGPGRRANGDQLLDHNPGIAP